MVRPEESCSGATEGEKCLKSYLLVARKLLFEGYYNWLLAVIRDCYKCKATFIVFDCPSGSGKTQTGVALLALSRTNVTICDKPLVVAHFVWQSAVNGQKIYEAIEEDQMGQSVNVKAFFPRAKTWLKMPDRLTVKEAGIEMYKEHIWDHCLSYVFLQSSMRSKFLYEAALFVLLWDEIPVESADLALIGELRDELKTVQNIVIILSGTNSKAANMIGLSTGKVSHSEIKDSGDYWSCLVTRMPKFVLESSEHYTFWSKILDSPSNHTELQSVIQAISISINGNGNPRLINMAISALETLHTQALRGSPFTFEKWQKLFSEANVKGKFAMLKWSEGSNIVKAQANLLLAASSFSPLADAIIHSHYGQRAFPDNGQTACCSLTPTMTSYGGWLKLCPPRWRSLGKSVYTGSVDLQSITAAHLDLQVTIFQPVKQDILLYFGSCWTVGYFAAFQRDARDKHIIHILVHTAIEVIRAFWESHVFGVFNFQNLRAPINTGAMVEVLVALSVMNAAVSESTASDFFDFFKRFLSQLGFERSELSKEMLADKAFLGLRIPQYVFPGTGSDCCISEKIGILERTADADNIDATLHGLQGINGLEKKVDKIHFEAKHRKSLYAAKVMEVIKRILKDEDSIGIMVASKSSKFEVADGRLSEALVHLQGLLNGTLQLKHPSKWSQIESKLGVGYFVNVNENGAGVVSSCIFDASKNGRFILITLPDLV